MIFYALSLAHLGPATWPILFPVTYLTAYIANRLHALS